MVQNDSGRPLVMPGSEGACRQVVVESKETQMKFEQLRSAEKHPRKGNPLCKLRNQDTTKSRMFSLLEYVYYFAKWASYPSGHNLTLRAPNWKWNITKIKIWAEKYSTSKIFVKPWEPPITLTLQDISAITSGYTLINMYLFQFDYKKGQKTGFHIK